MHLGLRYGALQSHRKIAMDSLEAWALGEDQELCSSAAVAGRELITPTTSVFLLSIADSGPWIYIYEYLHVFPRRPRGHSQPYALSPTRAAAGRARQVSYRGRLHGYSPEHTGLDPVQLKRRQQEKERLAAVTGTALWTHAAGTARNVSSAAILSPSRAGHWYSYPEISTSNDKDCTQLRPPSPPRAAKTRVVDDPGQWT